MNLLPAEVIFPRFKKCPKAQYLSPIDFHGRSYLKPPIKLISNRDNNTEIFLTLSHVITSRRFLFHFFFSFLTVRLFPCVPSDPPVLANGIKFFYVDIAQGDNLLITVKLGGS